LTLSTLYILSSEKVSGQHLSILSRRLEEYLIGDVGPNSIVDGLLYRVQHHACPEGLGTPICAVFPRAFSV
jgi:hypothetical protein